MAEPKIPVEFYLSPEDTEILARAAQDRHMTLNAYLEEFATILASHLRPEPEAPVINPKFSL